jgi:hypothetical protein
MTDPRHQLRLKLERVSTETGPNSQSIEQNISRAPISPQPALSIVLVIRPKILLRFYATISIVA